jgi:negative regulator of sigma E activity
MLEQQLQDLSAFVDGELPPARTEALLDALCRDDDLAAAWARLHRLRSLMAGDDVDCDVTQAVRAALVAEPAYLLPVAAPAGQRWPRYVIGGALAASVALLTVVGLRPWQGGGHGAQVAQTAPPSLVASDAARVETTSTAQVPNGLQDYRAVYDDNALFGGQEGAALVRDVRDARLK